MSTTLQLMLAWLCLAGLWPLSPAYAQQAAGATATPRVVVQEVAPRVRRVVVGHPPFNLVTPETVSRLHEVVTALEADSTVQVVIFASSTPGFFLNHFDLAQAARFPLLPTPEATPVWVDLVLRLSKAPFVSIAAIRGRTRGGGNELALAMDLRYASREQAWFAQPEVGTGIVPGGGGSERLPRLIGRDRALEVILGSEDFDATTAERYGWVTRSLPDAELDGFVLAMAQRLASFDRTALVAAKSQVDRASLPPDADLASAYREYSRSLANPRLRPRLARLGQFVAEKGAEVELNLGDYLGRVGVQP
ncbi:enoyl-CoA hydratase/isomerase family protein [Piscinibacter sakaiensis]|uniref:Enoyl-CoA hydratase n=1 Tax=Piscinibacter sakaiensis TaxID=1547922 RepID=A0A0K8P142_PISS1|nr:enoyl-CoA hydratase/isomerase family protein [Piscinibacter sakaiensis]GAP35890.1 enoyl-CoA hydratase [Piscinibacter sakaiensis]